MMMAVTTSHTCSPAPAAPPALDGWARQETRRALIERASDASIGGDVAAAVALLQVAWDTDPTCAMPAPFLAAFRHAVGDPDEAEAWARMREACPQTAQRAQGVIAQVDRFLDGRPRPVPAHQIDTAEPGTLIWLLGFHLKKDSSPRPRLLARLDATAALARRFPSASVLVSGGRLGTTPRSEASVMAGYLIAHGVDPSRLQAEHCSLETLENIWFARDFLADAAPAHVLLVSEDPHLARAAAMLDLTGWAASIRCVTAAALRPLTVGDRAAIYRDCLRLAGFPLYEHRAIDMVWCRTGADLPR